MKILVNKELYSLVHLLFNLDLDLELDFKYYCIHVATGANKYQWIILRSCVSR